MTVLPLATEDLAQLSALTPDGWGDLAPHFEYNIQSTFCTPLKVVVNEQLAGAGNVILNGDTAWLAQIVVHPGFRNQGLGRAITSALIEHIDRHRFPAILLDATDMGYPVYRSLGFETISHHVHFTGELLPETDSLNNAVIPYTAPYLQQVLQLDADATGEDRRNTLLEQVDKALLYLQQDQVLATYFPGLGRGPVTAKEINAGIALMKLRMRERTHAMLPEENLAAIRFLKEEGFKETRKSRRMCLGHPRNWNPEFIFNTTGGALG